jgi:thiol-disulfide isomerase/thioredoxin
MAGCPTERCLTVFLAPWCGYCRAATPAVRRLKEHFDARGVHTRVVVGKDKETNIREYAAELGPEAIVDPDWEFRFSGGLPHLFVSIEGGEVLVARPGLRADESPESVAMRLGLK